MRKAAFGLAKRLQEMRTTTPPFTEDLDKAQKNAHWVRPELVAQVEFTEWTRDGGIRHPSFKGLREDKPAADVVAEVPMRERDVADGRRADACGDAGRERGEPSPTQTGCSGPPRE